MYHDGRFVDCLFTFRDTPAFSRFCQGKMCLDCKIRKPYNDTSDHSLVIPTSISKRTEYLISGTFIILQEETP